jgi:hypothetical protein
MSFTLKRFKGEPLIVVRFTGVLTPTEMETLFNETTRLIDSKIYCLIDFSQAELPRTFKDTLKIARLLSQGKSGSPTDPRVIPAFIVNNYSGLVLKQLLQRKQFGALDIPIFFSLEAARQQMNHRSKVLPA